jgi:acyl carrier protein
VLDMDRDVRSVVRAFIATRLAPSAGRAEIADDEDLIDTGVVNSLGIFQLVAFLEERFQITIGDEEITPENFGTIDGIERLVASRIAARAA